MRKLLLIMLILLMGTPAAAQTDGARLIRSVDLDIGAVHDIALHGSTLVLATPNGLWRYDLDDPNAEAQPFGDFGGLVYRVTFNPDGSLIAADEERQVELIHILDATTGDTILTLDDDDQDFWIGDLAFSPDGTILAAGNHSSHIKLWNPYTGERLAMFTDHNREVMGLAFSPDGTLLASASFDRTLRLWDLGTNENWYVLRGHQNRLTSVAYSPDGSLIATGSADTTMRLWDANSGEVVRVLEGHTARVETVVFSPNGSILASAGRDNTIRLWDAISGESLVILEGHRWWIVRLVFRDDHTLISVGGDGEIRVWELASS